MWVETGWSTRARHLLAHFEALPRRAKERKTGAALARRWLELASEDWDGLVGQLDTT